MIKTHAQSRAAHTKQRIVTEDGRHLVIEMTAEHLVNTTAVLQFDVAVAAVVADER